MDKLIVFTIFLISCPFAFSIDARIPKHILECYRRNMTDIYQKTQVPMTMPVLIELLQKVELSKTLDLRLLTTSLIYRAKFDGIQRAPSSIETENIVPVGPSQIHYKKFKILLNYLLSGNEDLFPNEALTKSEFCLLHRMISSSVQAWERGDETKTCPQIQMMPNNGQARRLISKQQKSSCPIEKGVIKSRWGGISAGHLLLAISAALQNQDVKLMQIVDLLDAEEHIEMVPNSTRRGWTNTNEEINNLWATTLAGDLGEVVAYQQLFVTKLLIGTPGIWNDTLLPRAYYLPDAIGSHWEMTLAESLGGMDGVIIGNQVKDWTQQTGRLRFSQILDMYYSRRGTHFDEAIRACQRKENIKKILADADLVKQTTGMAKLLQYYYQSSPSAEEWVPIQEEEIGRYVQKAVEEFTLNLDGLTDIHSACEKGYDVPPLDIFVVIDGSFSGYDGRRLIGSLAHASDVSRFGSRMGVISGSRGLWMTNFTNSVIQIFEDLTTNEHLWPSSMSLPSSLSTITQFLNNKTDNECMDKYRSTQTSVIVIISPTSSLSSIDLENSRALIQNMKSLNPGTVIVYVTSDLTRESYISLAKNEYTNDKIITTEPRIRAITEKVALILKDVPGQIIELHCDTDMLHYEDYLIPNMTTTYEIHYRIMQEANINVEFSGHEYGNLSICGSDKAFPEHKLCQWLDERNSTASFHTKALCRSDEACTAQFRVGLVHSRNKCTDDECRYPNQGRIQILTTWNAGTSINANFISIAIAILVLARVFSQQF